MLIIIMTYKIMIYMLERTDPYNIYELDETRDELVQSENISEHIYSVH